MEATLQRKNLAKVAQALLADDPSFFRNANAVLPKRAAVPGGLEVYAGPWNASQARHLLRRTLFGITPPDFGKALTSGLSATVTQLLTVPAELPSPPVNVSANDLAVPIGTTWVTAAYDTNVVGDRRNSLISWWIGQMLGQGLSLREKMTLFWHNHFANELGDVGDPVFMYTQNQLFRKYAFGNFKELTQQVATDSAMLVYLNGNSNTKKNPNENFGRELQELFTIGKGPEIAAGNYTNYTEDDVKAAARVMTGWSSTRDKVTADFKPTNHDTTDKQFSAAYGNTVIKGRLAEDGAHEVGDLMDMIFAQPETARYLCRKLYRFFVYYGIDADTEKNVIEPMATLLIQNKFEVAPVLSALFQSAHFHHALNQGCLIKAPLDLVLGFIRQMGGTFPSASDLPSLYKAWFGIQDQCGQQQQSIFNPPNVAGWPAYYQDPVFYEMWINADTLPKRVRLTDTVITNAHLGTGTTAINFDFVALAAATSTPNDVKTLVAELADTHCPLPLTASQLAFLKDSLLDKLPDYEWGVDWDAYQKDVTLAAPRKAIETRLKAFFKALCALAEYQLA